MANGKNALGYADVDADTHLWKGTRHPCPQRRATVSVEGGSEQSPLGRDQGCMFVDHGARNPESTQGMAGREGGKGKLGLGWGEAQSIMRMSGQSLEGLNSGK